LVYVAQNGELTKVLRVRVSETMLADLVAKAEASQRSAGAVTRAAIRSYLPKGKR
jgi:hypothetical protein